MSGRGYRIVAVLMLIGVMLSGCSRDDGETGQAGVPNPASAYCEEQGYTLEIRTDENGGQYGVCVFPDGSECDEWAFYRGECGPGGEE